MAGDLTFETRLSPRTQDEDYRTGQEQRCLCLKSKTCTSKSTATKILNGLDLTVEQGPGARHHGPERLGQVRRCPMSLAGKADYEVTEGEILLDGESILGTGAGRARRQGPVPGLPVSDRNSRRCDHDVPAHGA